VLRLCERAGPVKLGHVAAKADAGDAAFGRDKSGEEMPAWVGDKKRRAEKIRGAKAELEAEAKAAAEAERQARAEADQKREAEAAKNPEDPPPRPQTPPTRKREKNFTDPESRIRLQRPGTVDAEAQGDRRPWPRGQRKRPAPTDAHGRRSSKPTWTQAR
jgi:hypothetical protein